MLHGAKVELVRLRLQQRGITISLEDWIISNDSCNACGSGMPIKQMAEELDIPAVTLNTWRYKLGLSRGKKKKE